MPTSSATTPAISGTDQDGSTLTASQGGGSNGIPAPSYAYQWERCSATGASCTAISGATSGTYALGDSDVGHELRVLGTASNASYYGGGSAQSTSQATAVTDAVPTTVAATPTISGTAQDGSTLTASQGGSSNGAPAPSYSYQWQRCQDGSCSAIPGATATTYAPTDADIGYELRVEGEASNASYPGGGEANTASSPTSEVGAAAPVLTSAPTLSGTDTDGSTLASTRGSWSSDPAPAYSYQWQLCGSGGTSCTVIAGATSSIYGLTDADVGHYVRALVTASDSSYPGGGEATATTLPSGVIDAVAPQDTASPAISGTAQDGDVLTATTGAWSGAPTPTYAYQWQRSSGGGGSFVAISGATGTSYTLTDADVGHQVRAFVVASNASYPGGGEAGASSTASASVVAVAPSILTLPSISGSDADGSTLTATPGSWGGDPTPALSYQWERCSGSGEGCSAIPGATGPTYALTDADVGHAVEISISATNAAYLGGGAQQAQSEATASVQATPTTHAGAPAVSGSAIVGFTLTASNDGSSNGAPAPSYAYQWQDCDEAGLSCTDISGATTATYTPTGSDVGSTIRVIG